MRTPCGMFGVRAVEEAIAEMETTTSRREFLALLRKGYVDAIASHEETMRLLDKTNELSRVTAALNGPAIANVPIIAMTANAFDEDMHSAMKSGMNGYLSKPLDVDKLYAMMRKCLK